MNFKALSILALLASMSSSPLLGQSTLDEADSLFRIGKYTEAFGTYDSLLQQGDASEQMLLKMAFIQEGLQDYTSALYYLTWYYELSGDKKVLGKMTEIAQEHKLVGYEFDDVDLLANIFDQYRLYVVLALTALALALFGVFAYNFQRGNPVVVPVIFVVAIIVGLFFATNDIFTRRVAIISSDHTILRSAPSAAAEPLEMIDKGHRVEVLSEDKVWIRILWQDREAYLRKGRVMLI